MWQQAKAVYQNFWSQSAQGVVGLWLSASLMNSQQGDGAAFAQAMSTSKSFIMSVFSSQQACCDLSRRAGPPRFLHKA